MMRVTKSGARCYFTIGTVALAFCQSASARICKEAPQLAQIVKASGVVGTFVLFDREADLLEKTDSYQLHRKTGWLFDARQQVGWWVGWIERDGKSYPFALNIDMKSDADAEKRVPLGRALLKALGKL